MSLLRSAGRRSGAAIRALIWGVSSGAEGAMDAQPASSIIAAAAIADKQRAVRARDVRSRICAGLCLLLDRDRDGYSPRMRDNQAAGRHWLVQAVGAGQF
jgi:hypothetical protein